MKPTSITESRRVFRGSNIIKHVSQDKDMLHDVASKPLLTLHEYEQMSPEKGPF